MEVSPLGLEMSASFQMEEDTRVLSNLQRRSWRSWRGISRRSRRSRKSREGRVWFPAHLALPPCFLVTAMEVMGGCARMPVTRRRRIMGASILPEIAGAC